MALVVDDPPVPIGPALASYLRWYAERFARRFPDCPVNAVHWDACTDDERADLLELADALGLAIYFGDTRDEG